MWLKKNALWYHVGRVKVGLCLQLVFRSTCRALTRACPKTGTPCFRTFGREIRTWPVLAQGGGGVCCVEMCCILCVVCCVLFFVCGVWCVRWWCVVWSGVAWHGVVWCGVAWHGVARGGVLWCVVCGVWCVVCGVWCVVWCGMPKALLPEGKDRDVYPRVQVNGRAVCVACAPCASVLPAAESGNRETWRLPIGPLLLAQELPRDSVPLRMLVQA